MPEETGSEVRDVGPGDFVVGSFFASDGTCEICQAGWNCPLTMRDWPRWRPS